MKKYIPYILISALLGSCKEDKLPLYDDAQSALNFAKTLTDKNGNALEIFGPEEDYPGEYSFNAYFLGTNADDYTYTVPVRLSGTVDYTTDRPYRIKVNDEKSKNAINGIHYDVEETQIFRKGLYQDSLAIVIYTNAMDETSSYKLYIELVPNEYFDAGIPEYQFIEINFTKNLEEPPAFWTNTSKLSKFTYHPRKCAVFLQISRITSPDWEDNGATIQLDYWISLATQWFINHPEYDENGNRIYFDE